MAVEGVLAGRDDDVELNATGIDHDALRLYAGLASTGRLVLATKLDPRLVDHWCRINGLGKHQHIVPLDSRTVTRARSSGDDLTLYIDHDGDRVAAALQQGVPTLLFSKPLYARQGHRPDLPQLRRPFAAVLSEARAQREARALPVID